MTGWWNIEHAAPQARSDMEGNVVCNLARYVFTTLHAFPVLQMESCEYCVYAAYEGVSKSFRTESITNIRLLQ
jgi:hypothetical protein